MNGGAGSAFGDGLTCASGTVHRLGAKINVTGASSYPQGSDLPIHVQGAVAGPGERYYQAWYRNVASFCTPAGFNLTNGLVIRWAP